jgi:hypothetical protein
LSGPGTDAGREPRGGAEPSTPTRTNGPPQVAPLPHPAAPADW